MSECRRVLKDDAQSASSVPTTIDFPRRHRGCRPGLLDPERRHLAQVESDCPTSRVPASRNAHENADLGRQVRSLAEVTFNYDALKPSTKTSRCARLDQSRSATGRRTPEARPQEGPTRRKKDRKASCSRVLLANTNSRRFVVLDPSSGTGTTSCGSPAPGARTLSAFERDPE